MTPETKTAIELCKTEKDLKAVLKKYGLKIIRDESEERGYTTIWISETTRIYKPYGWDKMRVQYWRPKEKMVYSGIPTFF